MFSDPHLVPREANYQPLTPLSFLDRALQVWPHQPALAWRGDRWSYAEFGDLVFRMIAWLREQGVKQGDVVSVVLTNRPETLAAHFAIPALGAVLNTINTRVSGEEIAYIVDHAQSALLICEPATKAVVPELDIPVTMLCSSVGDADGENFFEGAVKPVDLLSKIENETQPVAVNYTSGTTGKPKGVVYTHRGAYLNAIGNTLEMEFTTSSRYLWTLPMFHCNGWTHTWAVTAAGGLHVCLEKVDPALVIATIEAEKVTHMCCAPVVLYMLLNKMDAPAPVRVKVGTGGAAPTPTLIAGLEELGFDLMHLYGLTESYGPTTLNVPGANAPTDLTERAAQLARQGYHHKIAGPVRVVDYGGKDVPRDGETIGEIVLRGNTIMAGYLMDPEETEKVFADGVFHTGDLAVMHSDGQIEIRDRAKDIIISGGENFSSLEVETVLHQHPSILLAAVVGAPHPKWGEVAWAFIESADGNPLDEVELDTFCRARLAGFKRPKKFVFCELPKTATGKIQKFVLRNKSKEMASNEPD